MSPSSRASVFRGEYLCELEIERRQSAALAAAPPEDVFGWRPHPASRSVSEVLIHVAAGNFMLLDIIGVPAPSDLYAKVPASGPERFAALIPRNDHLEKPLPNKPTMPAHLNPPLSP